MRKAVRRSFNDSMVIRYRRLSSLLVGRRANSLRAAWHSAKEYGDDKGTHQNRRRRESRPSARNRVSRLIQAAPDVPEFPHGMPTLPAFTTLASPTVRSNYMCVCPQTTTASFMESRSKRGPPRETLVHQYSFAPTCSCISWAFA